MFRRWLLRNFRVVYRLDRAFRRRFTAAGYLVLAGLVAALVVGINTRLNLASQLFTWLLALLLLSIGSGLGRRPRLQLQRHLPSCATVQVPLRYQLRLANPGPRWQRDWQVLDELQDTWPSVTEFQRCRDPADAARNPFDRYIGYPRWLWLVQGQRGADSEPVAMPAIPPGGTIEVTVELTPRRRGWLYWQGYCLSRNDPLGLYRALHRTADPARLLVLPKRYPLPPRRLHGGRLYQPGGVTLAATAGDAEEFYALREYRTGDSLRSIHWKSWAKTGRPIVRETRPEYFTRHALMLDTALPPGSDDTLFEEAVAVAASFACVLDTREALLDLLFVGTQAYQFTAGRGLDSGAGLLKILACVQAAPEQPFAALHAAVLERADQFSSGVLVLLTWDTDRRALVQQLRQRRIQTLTLVLTTATDPATLDEDVITLPVDRIAEQLWQRLST